MPSASALVSRAFSMTLLLQQHTRLGLLCFSSAPTAAQQTTLHVSRLSPHAVCAARRHSISTATSSTAASTEAATATANTAALKQHGLDPWTGYGVGIEKAVTLPASWYTQPAAAELEKQHVLYNTWQMVCCVSQVQQPGDYVCGSIGDVRYLVVRGQDGQLRAFHNVCRHHAAAVAQGCGNQASMQFACPYHGWTYDTRGRLVKATRLKGIQDFKAATFGLHPIAVDTWGHLVFLHLQGGAAGTRVGTVGTGTEAKGVRGRGSSTAGSSSEQQQQQQQQQQESAGAGATPADGVVSQQPVGVAEWLGAGGQRLHQVGMSDSSLVHIQRREYVINCNWKVFADNYLDGGYHVPYAHKDLSSGLDLSGYTNEMHEVLSIQSCAVQGQQQSQQDQQQHVEGVSESSSSGGSSRGSSGSVQLDRLGGRDAAYAFVFPNLMINRYGPWMDTNLVLPLTGSSVDRCRVVFDYWLDTDALHAAAAATATKTQTALELSGFGGSSSSSGSAPASTEAPAVLSAGTIQAALQSQFVQDSLASSHQVQVEDIALCEAVQLGLQEPAYEVGRYAPGPEVPMYHYHSLLYGAVVKNLA